MAARKPSFGPVMAAVLVVSVAACTTATPYQPYRPEISGGIHGGYSDRRLQPDRFIVRFHGNELTSRQQVETYLLFRAAELTVQNGYDWFTIVDRHTEHDVQTYSRPDPIYGTVSGSPYAYWRPHWRYLRRGYDWDVWHPEYGGQFWSDRLDTTTVESFEVSAEIALHRGPMAVSDRRAFDARRVMAELRPTIKLPKRR